MKQTIRYQDGYSLSYAEYGDPSGYPILIQHGLIASINDGSLFERLIRLGTRLICIARPGYGESSPYIMKNMADWANIVSVLIDHLELSHFDILGMSSGAPYSYAIGYQFSDKVRNIFIFSGIPALYDDKVVSFWPWEVKKDAEMTAKLLPNCKLDIKENDVHFSNEVLDDFIKTAIAGCYGVLQGGCDENRFSDR
jgi:pimeloyl-ACP methyl ester carboxylesterase